MQLEEKSIAAIDTLPDEVLLRIFSFTTITDLLVSLPRVCARWRVISDDRELWRNIVFTVCLNDEDALLQLTESCPNVEILHLTGRFCREPDSFFSVSRLRRLRTLSLLQVTGVEFQVSLDPLASGCPQLSKLEINVDSCTANSLEKFLLSKNQQLTSLTMRWDSKTTRRFTHLLNTCKLSLLELKLLGCHNVTVDADTALQDLQGQTRLKFLKVTGGFRQSPTTPELIGSGHFSHIREIFLSCGKALDDTTVSALWNNCPDLDKVFLLRNTHLSDAALEDVHRCPKLRVLDVSYCSGLNSKALGYIALCASIEELYLRHLDFYQLGVHATSLLKMCNLKTLSLEYSSVAGVPLIIFPKYLQHLETLLITGCKDLETGIVCHLEESFPSLNVF